MNVLIKRLEYGDRQVLGIGFVFSGLDVKLIFKTLELPWKHNERQVSCIPPGQYEVERRRSDRFGDHFHIQDVPDRDLILIHAANHYTQLKGCIAVGHAFADINGDKLLDLVDSRAMMAKLNSLLVNDFELEIV